MKVLLDLVFHCINVSNETKRSMKFPTLFSNESISTLDLFFFFRVKFVLGEGEGAMLSSHSVETKMLENGQIRRTRDIDDLSPR